MRLKILIFCLLAFPSLTYAQFYLTGTESSKVKWSQIETPAYRVIYPRGLDSLGRVYAKYLESAVDPVSSSIGYRPNQPSRKLFPVILHNYSSYSNGMVGWVPNRMELMTLPNFYEGEGTPWEQHLIIHESRHAAQMQFTREKTFRWMNVLSGQILSLGLEGLYCGFDFFEGDAVATETALNIVGRGRTADFLEYYRVSFDEGKMRDYPHWTFKSGKKFTPDYYRSGYVFHAGVRSELGITDYTKLFYANILKHKGLVFRNTDKVLKEQIGKNFKESYAEICDGLSSFWQKDKESRAPFMSQTPLTENGKFFTEYQSLNLASDGLYAVRSGLTLPTELVRIDTENGKNTKLAYIASMHTAPKYSEATGRLYWSEYFTDKRWEQHSYSDICFWDGKRKRRLTHNQRLYHPASSKEDALIAVTEVSKENRYAVCVMDAYTGEIIERFDSPSGLQPVEAVWAGNELYTSAISSEGFGIYKVDDGFSAVLEPQAVKIKQVKEYQGKIVFTCDRTSVNELYMLDPHNGDLFQLSSTPLGAADFCFDPESDRLFYSSLSTSGRMICSTPVSELEPKKVLLSDIASYPFVDDLKKSESLEFRLKEDIDISEPKNYSKLKNLIRFHSWVPLFVDYDSVSDLSFSSLTSICGLGATAFFQNDLGTAWGSVAFKAHDDHLNWRPSGHISFNYSGLYPVIEAKLHFNEDRNSCYFFVNNYDSTLSYYTSSLSSSYINSPNLRSSVKLYIPWNFYSGGVSRGLIPTLNYVSSSDRFFIDGKSHLMSKLNASLRAYAIENIPNSRIYPRWGIGAEIGYGFRPSLYQLINSNAYAYIYAYIPGFYQTHGVKLSLLGEKMMGNASMCEPFANTVPRAYDSAALSALASFPIQTKLSVDYAMPLFAVDWAILRNIAFIRDFEFNPHYDYSYFASNNFNGNLYSVGADFVMRFSCLFNVICDLRLGVSYNYNSGSLYGRLKDMGRIEGPHDVGLVFSVDF